MLDKYINEQPVACKILKKAIEKNNISHAYLFISNQYSKTINLVLDFAKEIIIKDIENDDEKEDVIYKIENGLYNDILIIDTDEIWIKKEEIEKLQREFSNKSLLGRKRIYIINNAHKLNKFSANSILKFLEEPEDDIVALLITDNKYQLLETITSRCININLIDDKNIIKKLEGNTKEKIAYILLNNKEEIEKFIQDEKKDKIIEAVINFIIYYESNNSDTLLYLNKLFHEQIKDKKDIQVAFDIMILFYTDILNKSMNREINIFEEYDNEIIKMCNKNTIEQICEKIKILIDLKGKIKYNLNSKLLMDKLVILLGVD